MAGRYNAYDSRSSTTSSHYSDPSSSSELNPSLLKHKTRSASSYSQAMVKCKPSDLSRTKTHTADNRGNLSAMVKKFMEMRSNSSSSRGNGVELVIPSDLIAEDLKKTARTRGGNAFGGLQRKLFGKTDKVKKETKALTEVKGSNTRTLAMVLRSERELLSMNKEQEMEIAGLKLMLEEKNREVEKLKNLCLKQRQEIKSLKDAVLFPDVMNSQLEKLLEKQGSELKQARHVIPSLQRQVTSLTGQLQCLAEGLAEVKAEKYSANAGFTSQRNLQRTSSSYDDHEEFGNSLDFSSNDPGTPGSAGEVLLEDVNPCLTPCPSKSKSKEYETPVYHSPPEALWEASGTQTAGHPELGSCGRKLSRSSDCCQNSKAAKSKVRPGRRSEESRGPYGKKKQMGGSLF